ncbi:MAG: sulfoxide reductase heme-binding subunit YedZ [Methylomonas sp.]|nr:sulfoxide reductase heme-binding subunit YedZ [Methylomonas sp.]
MPGRISHAWMLSTVACLLPLFVLIFNVLNDQLGANPVQAIHVRLGDWALRFLWITLAITPIQTVTKWRGMADYRQMFGLYAFFYASLHVLAYLFVDHAGVWSLIVVDILESAYVWFGVLAYMIVLLLALTSPNAVKKRLGRSWKKLHRLIYYAAAAAIVHYFWQLKGNLFQPLFYLTIIMFLLGFRVLVWMRNRRMNRLMIPKGRVVSLEEGE